ncbi:hypothetical protein D3C71_1383580 [compost metagenome]
MPNRVSPQNEPTASPTRMIPVSLVNPGFPTPKISAGVARESTLFLFIEILNAVFQVKSSVLILTVLMANSKPLFSILPIFLVIKLYPLVSGTGASNSMSVVLR